MIFKIFALLCVVMLSAACAGTGSRVGVSVAGTDKGVGATASVDAKSDAAVGAAADVSADMPSDADIKAAVSEGLVSVTAETPLIPGTRHTVYFEQTDYELHVYDIVGRELGQTMMIIGGIQGDEPGGYLAADLYADMSLKRGRLILVPRANFLSIVRNRRAINRDMNRRFAVKDKKFYEDRVVGILKALIHQSDILLNLHEGSGFYRERWMSGLMNPMRFGQCIIADTDVYHRDDGRVFNLRQMTEAVVARVNAHIDENIGNELYHFRFNNHQTRSPASRHKEQRHSATFYALYTAGIPAFGVETSKEIKDLDGKVRMQSTVINAFMDEVGIVPENPSMYLPTPELKYALVQLDGAHYQVLKPGQTIVLPRDTKFRVTHIEANYKRGLTVDVLGYGAVHDLNRPFRLGTDARLVFRKDNFVMGEANIRARDPEAMAEAMAEAADGADGAAPLAPPPVIVKTHDSYAPERSGGIEALLIRHNNRLKVIPEGGTYQVNWGDRIRVLGSLTAKNEFHSRMVHNFVGYYGGVDGNVEDDTGLNVPMERDVLLKRFSKSAAGDLYEIYTKYEDVKIAHFYIKAN